MDTERSAGLPYWRPWQRTSETAVNFRLSNGMTESRWDWICCPSILLPFEWDNGFESEQIGQNCSKTYVGAWIRDQNELWNFKRVIICSVMTGFIRGSTSLHSKQLVCLRVVCGGVVCLQARSRVTRVPDRETQTTSVEIVFICKFRLSIATVKNLSFTLSLSYIKANVHRIALKNREYRSLGTLLCFDKKKQTNQQTIRKPMQQLQRWMFMVSSH